MRILTLRDAACFVCGSRDWNAYFSAKEYPQYNYQRCRECKFIQLVPVPKPDELKAFYETLWSDNKKDSYGERYFNVGLPDEAVLREWYGPLFLKWENYLPPGSEKRRFLEVGPGRGNVLAAARMLGWDSVGIDVSEQSAERLIKQHGFEIKVGDFCSLPLDDIKKFDIVHMSHVFEHMRDPELALRQIRKILKPNGLFCFTVPAIDENLFNVTSGLWKFLYDISGGWNAFYPYFWCFFSIGHISCFSSKTAERFLTKNGFFVQSKKYSMPRWTRTESFLRHIRSVLMTPLFLITKSGWELSVIAQVQKPEQKTK